MDDCIHILVRQIRNCNRAIGQAACSIFQKEKQEKNSKVETNLNAEARWH
jgi:hypothetical protein